MSTDPFSDILALADAHSVVSGGFTALEVELTLDATQDHVVDQVMGPLGESDAMTLRFVRREAVARSGLSPET